MILAAGLGTRLHPLTDSKPKALVEIGGKALLEIAILKMLNFGYNEIVINVHHYSSQIISFLEQNQNFGAQVFISDESDILLDTGGGLIKAAHFLKGDSPFLLYNVDILTDLDLFEMGNIHNQSANDTIATLFVNERLSGRSHLINNESRLCGWKNNNTGETKIPVPYGTLEPVSFCGIHIINPKIFNLIKNEGIFSMIDLYLSLCKDFRIHCWRNNKAKWLDVGTIENLAQAEKLFF